MVKLDDRGGSGEGSVTKTITLNLLVVAVTYFTSRCSASLSGTVFHSERYTSKVTKACKL